MSWPGFWQRLQQRKLVQWALAYMAAAFALLQGVDMVAQRFAWPETISRALIIVACIGFFVALLLAWYHGERGAQKVSGTELLLLTLFVEQYSCAAPFHLAATANNAGASDKCAMIS